MPARTNQDWIQDLSAPGPAQEAALDDLRLTLLKGLPYALSKWLSPDDPQFDALVEESVQDTLLRVLDRLDTFQGLSQFTTWVYKIAIRIALTELRRRRWRDVSLDELTSREGPPPPIDLVGAPGPSPELTAENNELVARVMDIIAQELTPKQRQAMMALTVQGVPMDEVARRMATNRNALYKLLHDARLRLKKRLAAEGLTPADVLSVFDQG
jgi:RNA polymerase sigma-70 factor (ECF subfamily)